LWLKSVATQFSKQSIGRSHVLPCYGVSIDLLPLKSSPIFHTFIEGSSKIILFKKAGFIMKIPDVKREKLNYDDEITLHQGLAGWCKSDWSCLKGYGILTNKRFIFTMPSAAVGISKAVSKIFKHFAEGGFEAEIPYESIENISEGRYGIRKALIIETKDGSTYKFAVNNYNIWADIISEHML
jgi:hypothetical protein